MSSSLLTLQTAYWQARDYLSPVLKESKFKEHGRITPEEFVAAGDFLTYKFPVWQWEKGDPSRARDFLPSDKQYLITRNVPCLRRATAVNYTDADEDAEKLLSFLDEAEEAPGPDGKPAGEDDWVATHISRDAPSGPIAEIPDMDGPSGSDPAPELANLSLKNSGKGKEETPKEEAKEEAKEDEIPDIDDIPDMEEAVGLEDDDDAVVKIVHPSESEVKSTLGQNLLAVRTYDIYISYDKHYQTPRFWLFGYDENKKPLTPAETFQDVPSEVAFKTLTMEPFPHSGQQLASIHPCKHASVMKTFVARMDSRNAGEDAAESKGKRKWGIGGMVRRVTGSTSTAKEDKKDVKEGKGEDARAQGVQVDFYLVIFLKFISSIVPTIEVDSTTATVV